jgi:hypothetical protein
VSRADPFGTREEIMRISQIVMSSPQAEPDTLKYSTSVMAFTEYGIAMLSGEIVSNFV